MVDRDLYVVCLDSQHTIIAHGAFPSFVGSSSDVLKDVKVGVQCHCPGRRPLCGGATKWYSYEPAEVPA